MSFSNVDSDFICFISQVLVWKLLSEFDFYVEPVTMSKEYFQNLEEPVEEISERALVRYIVTELAKDPFSLEYNVASFCNLSFKDLLSVLNVVLTEIDSREGKVALGYDNLSETMGWTLELLQVLRYQSFSGNLNTTMEGLQEGKSEVIWSILGWLLPRIEDLKKRAYLAQFLVKINIPEGLLNDNETRDAYELYENKIEEFKAAHKTTEKMKKCKGTAEMIRDVENMEHDQLCLRRKLDKVRAGIESIPNAANRLKEAAAIRKERQTKQEVQVQIEAENNKANHFKNKYRELQKLYQQLYDKNSELTGEGLMLHTEDDYNILHIEVYETLPREVDELNKVILAMEIVENQPPLAQNDLTHIQKKIDKINKEIVTLEFSLEEKQANEARTHIHEEILTNELKKKDLTEQIEESTKELIKIKRGIEGKLRRHEFKTDGGGEPVVSDESYKEFIRKMRMKTTKYKHMKEEIFVLQSEVGVLATTKFILEGDCREGDMQLEMNERRLGVVGFTHAQDRLEVISSQKAAMDEEKIRSLHKMSCLSKEMYKKVSKQKIQLEPLLNHVNKFRQQCELLEMECDQKRIQFESELMAIQKPIREKTESVKALRQSYQIDQLKYAKLKSMLQIINTNLKRAKDEKEICTSSSNTISSLREGVNFFRDRLFSKIVEQERIYNTLLQEKDSLQEFKANQCYQMEMWSNLMQLLATKTRVQEESYKSFDNHTYS